MPFDSGVCAAVADELNSLLYGAKIEKIHQPSKDSFLFQLHPQTGDRKSRKLIIDAGASNSRICLTESSFENPSVPPSFCMLLRKRLSGARIEEITQIGFDRVIRITFSCFDELGFPVTNYIYAEIMGKFSNIIFCGGDKKVISATKLSDITSGGVRPVYPGMTYSPPPSDRLVPLTADPSDILSAVGEGSLSKGLIRVCCGFSPLSAREIEYRAAKTSPGRELADFADMINGKRFSPCIIRKSDGSVYDFSFERIYQYGAEAVAEPCASMSEVIDGFYSARASKEIIDAKSSDIRHLIGGIRSRIITRLEKQRAELENYGGKDAYRKKADLITANLYRLKKGMLKAKVVDYEDENCPEVELELDPILSPSQYASHLYKLYTKSKNGEIKLRELIESGERELDYIDSVAASIDTSENSGDIDEIRRELAEQGYIKKKNGSSEKAAQSQPLYFRTSSGYRVVCGKNNKQNDFITHKLAEKSDIWFHINGYHGSHVVLFANGEEPPAEDYTEAAVIAASYSSASPGQKVRVDYTQVRNLKKPPMSQPGFVTFSTNFSAYVVSDKAKAEKMLEKNIKKS